MRNKYILFVVVGIILVFLGVVIKRGPKIQTKDISSNENIESEDIRKLIPEILDTAKNRHNISKNAYIRCEITFNSNYNNNILDLSILDRNKDHDWVEYKYTKLNGEALKETLRTYYDDVESFEGKLLLTDFKVLVLGLEDSLLHGMKGKNYFLTVRDYSIETYKMAQNNQAFAYYENKFNKVDTADGHIGISIKDSDGLNEIALYLK